MILPHIPPHETYIEPFAGGASIFLAKGEAQTSWLNDRRGELINAFRCIQQQPEELIALLRQERVGRDRYTYIKESLAPSTALERAFRYFYLNRSSYAGIMRV